MLYNTASHLILAVALSSSTAFGAAIVASDSQTACDITNWNFYLPAINWADDKLMLGQSNGIVQAIAAFFNPLTMGNVNYDASAKVLNSDFDFSATVNSATLDGVDTIYLNPISLASSTAFKIGGYAFSYFIFIPFY